MCLVTSKALHGSHHDGYSIQLFWAIRRSAEYACKAVVGRETKHRVNETRVTMLVGAEAKYTKYD
jgi:hypothetical protein